MCSALLLPKSDADLIHPEPPGISQFISQKAAGLCAKVSRDFVANTMATSKQNDMQLGVIKDLVHITMGPTLKTRK